MLWIQLQELPWHVKGDAAGELDVGDGTWTEELRERYADRIQARLARAHPEPRVGDRRKRVVALARRPRSGERRTSVHGDPYGGALALDQNFLWRPFPRQPGPRDAGRPALAHRREHLARPGPRRRLGHARRAGAPEARRSPSARCRAGSGVDRARSQISTLPQRSRRPWQDRAVGAGGHRPREIAWVDSSATTSVDAVARDARRASRSSRSRARGGFVRTTSPRTPLPAVGPDRARELSSPSTATTRPALDGVESRELEARRRCRVAVVLHAAAGSAEPTTRPSASTRSCSVECAPARRADRPRGIVARRLVRGLELVRARDGRRRATAPRRRPRASSAARRTRHALEREPDREQLAQLLDVEAHRPSRRGAAHARRARAPRAGAAPPGSARCSCRAAGRDPRAGAASRASARP